MSNILPEFVAMQAIADAVADLSESEKRRVAAWLVDYTAQEATSQTDANDTTSHADALTHQPIEDGSIGPEPISSFPELYEAVAPKTGAQKAVVAGYWIEKYEGRHAWKASEINKLLKSIDIKVSSISIVLTNAVKAAEPMVTELGRLGEGQRSRKTFRLNETGIAFVEDRLN